MTESLAFMVVTREKISKGDLITFEGKKCRITSINSVEPYGNKLQVIGKCKQTDIDKWSSVIKNSV